MKRRIKDLRAFDLVVLNNEMDATVWRVIDLKGHAVDVIDAAQTYAFPNIAPQRTDISLLQRPTKAQLDAFIEANGAE